MKDEEDLDFGLKLVYGRAAVLASGEREHEHVFAAGSMSERDR